MNSVLKAPLNTPPLHLTARLKALHVSVTDDEYLYLDSHLTDVDQWIVRKKFGFFLKDHPNVEYQAVVYDQPMYGERRFITFNRLNASPALLGVLNASDKTLRSGYLSYPMYASYIRLHIGDKALESHLTEWMSYFYLINHTLAKGVATKVACRTALKTLLEGYAFDMSNVLHHIHNVLNFIRTSIECDKYTGRVIIDERGSKLQSDGTVK